MTPSQTRERLQDHIFGSLATAALGDALGAATEQHTTDEIVAKFGGLLRELHAPSDETFSSGNLPGQITDDVSQMLALAQALIDSGAELSAEAWVRALIHWADTSPAARMMGPTTKPLLEALAAGKDTSDIGRSPYSTRKLTSFGATNGAAMRVAPAGLVCPGDIEAAVRLSWTSSRPTHATQIAAAGAGALAAGIAQALLPGADVFSVVRACMDGARLGEELGAREGRRVPGPCILRRIEIAVDDALRAASLHEALTRIEASVGNSVMMVETVPAAVGIFVAAGGDPFEAVVGGANIGNDTDTIAAIAGALAGALRGASALPPPMLQTVISANSEDIVGIAAGLTGVAWRRLSKA
jgi:ADP-ribosylglycohydrolase